MLGRRVLAGLRDQFAGVIVANEGQDDVTGRLTIAPAKRTVILSVSTPSDRWRGGVWMLAGGRSSTMVGLSVESERLVDRIYEAGLVPDLWPDLLV